MPIIFFCAVFFSGGKISEAHQARIVSGEDAIAVDSPEISRAFYAELEGEPDYFLVRGDAPFDLYVNALVPDVPGAQKNISFEIKKDGRMLAALDGADHRWKNFYEPFAGDNYFKGPEYRMRAAAGEYEIKVSNPGNAGKYVLAIGETEKFPVEEIFRTIASVPRIKKDFFGESAVSAYLNQITLLFLAIIIALAGITWLAVMAHRKKKKRHSL